MANNFFDLMAGVGNGLENYEEDVLKIKKDYTAEIIIKERQITEFWIGI